jgi:hypothetical protein
MMVIAKGFLRFTCIVAMLAMFSQSKASDARVEAKHQIFAAYLFNFAKFTQFSNLHQKTINLCIFGRNGINSYILNANQHYVGDNQIRVLIYPRFEDNLNYKHCQFSYINQELNVQTQQIIQYFSHTHALLFSALPNFIEQGGHVKFIEINDRVTFYFLASVVSHHPYKISSQVLALGQQAHE